MSISPTMRGMCVSPTTRGMCESPRTWGVSLRMRGVSQRSLTRLMKPLYTKAMSIRSHRRHRQLHLLVKNPPKSKQPLEVKSRLLKRR